MLRQRRLIYTLKEQLNLTQVGRDMEKEYRQRRREILERSHPGIPDDVPPFEVPEEAKGISRKQLELDLAKVHSGEGVLDGMRWVCRGNRWFASLDRLDDSRFVITEYERRGLDKRNALRRFRAAYFPDAPEGSESMAMLLEGLPSVEAAMAEYPRTANWRESPAIARRKAEEIRLRELRHRSKVLWDWIAEERTKREEAEKAEMRRQRVERQRIRADQRHRVQIYQNAWNKYRRDLRERYRRQWELAREEEQRTIQQAKVDWLTHLNQAASNVKEHELDQVDIILKNRRYLTYDNIPWFKKGYN